MNDWLKLEITKRESEIKALKRALEAGYMSRAKVMKTIDELERELISKTGELRALQQVAQQGETDGRQDGN